MIFQYSNCINYFNKIILNELKDVCETWIAGGAVRDYFSVGYVTSDIDLYFCNQEEYQKCYDYFLKEETSFDTPKAKLIFENDNVVKISYNKRKIDIIKKFFVNPEDSISQFDFTVCCAAVSRDNVFVHETFFVDLAKKSLVINKLLFPMSTMWRMQKYIKKGYSICTGGMLSIAKAISTLELHKEIEKKGEEQVIIETEFYPDGTPKFKGID